MSRKKARCFKKPLRRYWTNESSVLSFLHTPALCARIYLPPASSYDFGRSSSSPTARALCACTIRPPSFPTNTMWCGVAWTPEQCTNLARAWLAASENPRLGTDQTSYVFYNTVCMTFSASAPPPCNGQAILREKFEVLPGKVGAHGRGCAKVSRRSSLHEGISPNYGDARSDNMYVHREASAKARFTVL